MRSVLNLRGSLRQYISPNSNYHEKLIQKLEIWIRKSFCNPSPFSPLRKQPSKKSKSFFPQAKSSTLVSIAQTHCGLIETSPNQRRVIKNFIFSPQYRKFLCFLKWNQQNAQIFDWGQMAKKKHQGSEFSEILLWEMTTEKSFWIFPRKGKKMQGKKLFQNHYQEIRNTWKIFPKFW